MKFNLWQTADMQEPVQLIQADTIEQALMIALEACGYHLTNAEFEDELPVVKFRVELL